MLSPNLPWNLANPKWAQEINPVLLNPLNSVVVIPNVVLTPGVNVINTGLQQMQQGWFLVDQQGTATIYRSAPFNSLTLTLTSSASVTVSLGVF